MGSIHNNDYSSMDFKNSVSFNTDKAIEKNNNAGEIQDIRVSFGTTSYNFSAKSCWVATEPDVYTRTKNSVEDVFNIEKKNLGAGASGSVFSIRSDSTKKTKAAKIMLTDSEAGKKMAEREVAILKRIYPSEDPNKNKILTGVEKKPKSILYSDGLIIKVMKKYDMNLKELLETRTLTADEKNNIIKELETGLKTLHELGIAVIDIKAQNILVYTDKENNIHCHIIDFGIAKLVDDLDEKEKKRLFQDDEGFMEAVQRGIRLNGSDNLQSQEILAKVENKINYLIF